MDANHNLRCVDTVEEWAQFYDQDYRQIAMTGNDNIYISTVFLGVNHNFGFEDEQRPILFETMVFGGKCDRIQVRYCTYDEAMAGHKVMVAEVFNYAEGGASA
jgi:hypothetical protein